MRATINRFFQGRPLRDGIFRARLFVTTVLGCTVTLAGCGGGGGGDSDPATANPPPPVSSRPVAQTDAEIAALLYSDSARTPPDFYADSAPPVTGYVTTAHLKNTDLAPAATQHELCSDDWNDALAWSESVATAGTPYADLVATDANSRYFEFGRVPRGQADSYQRARVYRCAYLDRADVDLRAAAVAAGQINRRPITAADVRELSEYLWLFTSYNNFGNAVLASRAGSGAGRIEHTLYIARLQRAASGGCDRIEVVEWTHSADVTSGTLERRELPEFSFGARESAGSVQLCTP